MRPTNDFYNFTIRAIRRSLLNAPTNAVARRGLTAAFAASNATTATNPTWCGSLSAGTA
jgi:hypothetical protein